MKSAVLLSEVFQDKEWGPSYAPNQAAFNKYSGYPEPLFKYYEGVRFKKSSDLCCGELRRFKATPRGAELGVRFGVGMAAWSAAIDANSVITGISLFVENLMLLLTSSISIRSAEFPWKDLGHGTSVCDVGSGIGNMTLQLAKAYPTLKLKLQDLPECILQAKNEFWPKKYPEAIEEERIQFEPIDFLSESPIQGCDIYYVSNS